MDIFNKKNENVDSNTEKERINGWSTSGNVVNTLDSSQETESIAGLRATVTVAGGEDYQTRFDGVPPNRFRFYDSGTHSEKDALSVLKKAEERDRMLGSEIGSSVVMEWEREYTRILKEHGLSESRIQTIINRRKVTGEQLVSLMREFSFMKPEKVAQVYADIEKGIRFMSEKECEELSIDMECVEYFSGQKNKAMDSYCGIVPFEIYEAEGEDGNEKRCKVLLANPAIVDKVPEIISLPCDFYISTENALHKLFLRFYSATEQDIDSLIGKYRDIDDRGQDLDEVAPNLPSELLGNILRYTCQHKVSDIYFLCTGSAGLVRLKVDGTGVAFKTIPLPLYDRILTGLLPSGVDKRDVEKGVMRDGTLIPDDFLKTSFPDVFGRFGFRLEFGVSKGNMTLVVRLLDTDTEVAELNSLGFDPVTYGHLVRYRDSSNGLVLVTGPTGSGKTTTLYGILTGVDAIHRSVQTIENPVEYKNGLWMQYSVNSSVSSQNEGEAFRLILKGLLRNAPDVILVGEVRDSETAATLMEASNTGHLVFSSLHTSSAVLSLGRLRKLNVNPDDLANQLLGILAQRLVRLVCPKCGCKPDTNTADSITDVLRRYLPESEMSDFEPDRLRVASKEGCEYCNHTGYKGRHIVYELLDNNPEVQGLIESNEPLSVISRKGLRPYYHLWHSGLRLVKSGLSSLDEVQSVVSPEVWLMGEVAEEKSGV